MPERFYFISLTETDRIRVDFDLERRDVLRFVVQYETRIDNEFRPVVRYDTAHGQPHRDILGRNGQLISKDWLPNHWTLARCLTHAQDDLRAHWRTYHADFMGSE